jgi:hypothetical protein
MTTPQRSWWQKASTTVYRGCAIVEQPSEPDKAELREEAEMRQPAHVMLHRSADEVRQSAGRHDSLVDRFA